MKNNTYNLDVAINLRDTTYRELFGSDLYSSVPPELHDEKIGLQGSIEMAKYDNGPMEIPLAYEVLGGRAAEFHFSITKAEWKSKFRYYRQYCDQGQKAERFPLYSHI